MGFNPAHYNSIRRKFLKLIRRALSAAVLCFKAIVLQALTTSDKSPRLHRFGPFKAMQRWYNAGLVMKAAFASKKRRKAAVGGSPSGETNCILNSYSTRLEPGLRSVEY